MRILHWGEKLFLVVGLTLLGFCALVYWGGVVRSRMATRKFHTVANRILQAHGGVVAKTNSQVDFSLWSEKRIHAYEASLLEHFDMPQAMLRIGRLRLEVPVFDGTDDLILNRGVGRIRGSARPGETGNVAIAGHRDGFFRGLKDVAIGDSLQLSTPTGTQTYIIDSLRIVNPDDVSVLRNGAVPSVTLVTCYPFYFIGDAPRRYIVHASIEATENLSSSGLDTQTHTAVMNVKAQEKKR